MRIDHLVHEPLARGVDDVQTAEIIKQAAADGVHQVRLADADRAINEKRVVAARRHGGDRARGGVRQLIRSADDVCVERKPRI